MSDLPNQPDDSGPVASTSRKVPRKRRAFAFTLLAYGVFLIAIGAAGYANNPEKAKTALIFAGTFGAVHLLWSFLWNRKPEFARYAVAISLILVLFASTWRTWIAWQAFLDGDPSKKFVAFLLTAMALGTLRVFLRFVSLPKLPRSVAKQ
ncbi:MAG: hypothetical protein ACQKBT_03265 [Puniceicoccales bacterium]